MGLGCSERVVLWQSRGATGLGVSRRLRRGAIDFAVYLDSCDARLSAMEDSCARGSLTWVLARTGQGGGAPPGGEMDNEYS
eukprot:1352392-Rhodomonas_salina.1